MVGDKTKNLIDEIKKDISEKEGILHELLNDSADVELESFDQLYTRCRNKPVTPRTRTGIPTIDSNTGGFENGTFVIVAGRNYSGKSQLALKFLANTAESETVVLFSYEMYENLLTKKLSRISDKAKKNMLIEQKYNNLDIIIATIREQAKRGVRLFGIDSMMKITVNGNKEQYEAKSEITAKLSKLCQELGVIIFLIAQIPEQDQRNKRFGIKGTGDAAYDADVLFFLTVEEDESRVLHCTKDRWGERTWNATLPIDEVSLVPVEMEYVFDDSKVEAPTI